MRPGADSFSKNEEAKANAQSHWLHLSRSSSIIIGRIDLDRISSTIVIIQRYAREEKAKDLGRTFGQTCARRGYKQSCFSWSRRKVSRRKFISGISDISLYRGDEIKRDAIKGDERGRWVTIKGRRCSEQFRNGGEMEIHPRRSARERRFRSKKCKCQAI